MSSTGKRPRRESNDIFFFNGDRLALQTSDSILISYINIEDENDDEEEEAAAAVVVAVAVKDQKNNHTTHSGGSLGKHHDEYYDQGCKNLSFSENYRHHHHHRQALEFQYKCKTCQKLFSNEYLLDIHIHECHNVFVQLEQERRSIRKQSQSGNGGGINNTKLYKCLVENCLLENHHPHPPDSTTTSLVEGTRTTQHQVLFHSEYERCQHLITYHGYPKWFRFHSRKKKSNDVNHDKMKTFNTFNSSRTKSKMKWWYQKRMNYGSNTGVTIGDVTDTSQYRDKQDDDDDHDDDMDDNTSDQDSDDEMHMVSTSRITQLEEGEQEQQQQQETSMDVMNNGNHGINNDCSQNHYFGSSTTLEETSEQEEDSSIKMKKKTNMKQRKERKKKINATIPCRYYNSKGGCWRGDKCMFLHNKEGTTNNTNDGGNGIVICNASILKEQNENMNREERAAATAITTRGSIQTDICQEIDDVLVNEMKSKIRIGGVPDNISFGRSRKKR